MTKARFKNLYEFWPPLRIEYKTTLTVMTVPLLTFLSAVFFTVSGYMPRILVRTLVGSAPVQLQVIANALRGLVGAFTAVVDDEVGE